MKKPFTTKVESVPVLPGKGSVWGGWTKPLVDSVRQLQADFFGLRARVQFPVSAGKPSCYVGEKVFEPETAAFDLAVTSKNATATKSVNYIVRDGQSYTIPVKMPGPGVFVATHMAVSIKQRFYNPNIGAMWCGVGPMLNQVYYSFASAADVPTGYTSIKTPYNQNFSLFPIWSFSTGSANPAPGYLQPRAQCYLWNVLNSKSGRRLADDYMSHTLLLPRQNPNTNLYVRDGGFFEFPSSWLFERDGEATFEYYPITPILQYASSVDGTDLDLDFDDRENGVRKQSVRVRVEIHGYRFETDQDAMREGALRR